MFKRSWVGCVFLLSLSTVVWSSASATVCPDNKPCAPPDSFVLACPNGSVIPEVGKHRGMYHVEVDKCPVEFTAFDKDNNVIGSVTVKPGVKRKEILLDMTQRSILATCTSACKEKVTVSYEKRL
jgi:hypothetical protein